MKVAFFPISNDKNRFITITQDIIKSCGCDIVGFDARFFRIKTIAGTKIVFLNWYESVRYGFEIVLRAMALQLCLLLRMKIVVYFHNKMPHDTADSKRAFIKRYMRWLYKKADSIIVLSKSSTEFLSEYLEPGDIERKVQYIPLPNYIGTYEMPDESTAVDHDVFNVLFVGLIKPYKNIELILETAKTMTDKNIVFNIIGECVDDRYKNELLARAKDIPNVNLEFRFVSDDDFGALLNTSDVLIIPLDIKSSMNSSTVILAFSCKRTVICPRISTIEEYDMDNVYSYDYSTADEHLAALRTEVTRAYNDWTRDKVLFAKKGELLYEEVKRHNSVEAIQEEYSRLINRLTGK